ncbi:hypothetical protein RSAG8_00470, partial [Rhizoctonia solani AG-8 WAC10335]
FDQIQVHTTPHRDAFYDAPITSFSPGSPSEYNNSTVVIASGSLASALGGPMSGSTLNDTQIAALASQIQGAHAAGVKVRYWETPGWPLSKRDYIWKTLEGLGVDLLNADDLEAAAGLKETWCREQHNPHIRQSPPPAFELQSSSLRVFSPLPSFRNPTRLLGSVPRHSLLLTDTTHISRIRHTHTLNLLVQHVLR